MYFYYGITHSTLENPEEEIELKVDQKTYVTPPAQSVEQTAVWDRHGYENRMAEDGNSRNGGGGCWNAGNTINQGWGDDPAAGITVPSYSATKGSSAGNGTASRSSGAAAKGSSGTASSKSGSKTKSSRQPPPPPSKKPATKTPGAPTVPPTNPAPAQASAPKKDGFGMFVEETQFPTWDD